MPKSKLKTRKTISKRVKVSKGKAKTLTTTKAGQSHFNARETGKTGRNKRGAAKVSKSNERNVRRAISA